MYRCSLFKLLDLVLMLQIRQRGGMMTPQAASFASSVQSMQRLGGSMSSSGQRCVSTMACHVAFFGVLTVRTMLDLLVRAATYACSLARMFRLLGSLISISTFVSLWQSIEHLKP